MIELPAQLQHAIRQTLHQYPSHQWGVAARQLSERYRATRNGSPLITSALDALAYSAMHMPATYAQIYRALQMCMQHVDTSLWRSVLDIGSGPGTALWALNTLMPHITHRTAVERDQYFIALARSLCAPLAGTTTIVSQDITHITTWEPHDMVIIGHVLNELSPEQRSRVIDAAWQATRQLLVIIEPGTSAFFTIIQQARSQLIERGASVVAPCTHTATCPMTSDDWCHFGQKIARPDFQRQARSVQIGWEESKVSFVAAATHPVPISGQRIVHDPVGHKGHIALHVCSDNGLHITSIRKRDAIAHAKARRLNWGDIWTDGDTH